VQTLPAETSSLLFGLENSNYEKSRYILKQGSCRHSKSQEPSAADKQAATSVNNNLNNSGGSSESIVFSVFPLIRESDLIPAENLSKDVSSASPVLEAPSVTVKVIEDATKLEFN